VASRLAGEGVGVTVVGPRWIKPVDGALGPAARQHRLVAVVEDSGEAGGFGDAVCRQLRRDGLDTPVSTFGLPQRFLDHGTRAEVLEEAGLAAPDLAREIIRQLSRQSLELAPGPHA